MDNLFSIINKTTKLHIALGAFDGVHQAHASVINKALESAQTKGGESLILSFEPLPKEFFQHKAYPGRLLPASIKEYFLKSFGTDYVIIDDFHHVSTLGEKDFIEKLLPYADELHFYAGKDFNIGCNTGPKYKGEKLFIHHTGDININNIPCRATEIRSLIKAGLVEEAAPLLGREYVYYSHTISGSQIGRTIDFPTINIAPTNQVLPQVGVYFGELFINNVVYPASVYVGTRPTLNGDHIRIEAHVINVFPQDKVPQGSKAALRFIKKIFEEKGFDSLAKLKEMLYNYKQVSLALAAERYKISSPPQFPTCSW